MKLQTVPFFRTVDTLGELVDVPECASVMVLEPVRLGGDLAAELAHLVHLREATSRALRLRWRLAGNPLTALRDRVHLIPPVGASEEAGAEASAWQGGHTYGSFHYRVGPEFVTVKDARPGGTHRRMTISGNGCSRFLEIAQGQHNDSDKTLEVLAAIKAAGLALSARDTVLVLPFRMRHWPVPYHSA